MTTETGTTLPTDPEARVALARRWVGEYPPKPHPELGRSGVVCPYMVRALARDYVHVEGFAAAQGDDALADRARTLRDGMLARSTELGSDRIYLVSVVVPHGLPEPELKAMVDRVHGRLRAEFVTRGYMAGDFWPNHDTPGLHHSDFRPFASPLPMLGMRPMVPADLMFFVTHERDSARRLTYLGYFREVFADRLNDYWAGRLDEEASLAAEAVRRGDPAMGPSRGTGEERVPEPDEAVALAGLRPSSETTQ
ncbi:MULTISPECIES: DUF6875 domain-containing protein [Actinoalloteichus]|uniref:DUF6875 domain-containing protein n=1 Tax=Actinoalloteichus fjordicus TaxID=1612552 RepID=A0AAC9LD28_9PSEU|nr:MULTISPECIES: hypothetical protein [Actinoalloteichus]APU15402.1 hypothetical protein UA74_16860 [Actinoalloteichus fjordicus]APU21469.1 hypothetical protein UA75_17395 [Actinoalloteichus sp. GBA129-24]